MKDMMKDFESRFDKMFNEPKADDFMSRINAYDGPDMDEPRDPATPVDPTLRAATLQALRAPKR